MQVTKGTWHMHEQCVPGSLSSSPAQEPGNEARSTVDHVSKSMMSLAIDNAARDSMMQLTGQNRFTRSLSGGY